MSSDTAKQVRRHYDQRLEDLIAAAVRAGAPAADLILEELRPGDWIRCTALKIHGVELGRVVVKRVNQSIIVETITDPVPPGLPS